MNGEDGKMVKPILILEYVMDVWNAITNSFTNESCIDFVMRFRYVCANIQIFFLKYVQTTILD